MQYIDTNIKIKKSIIIMNLMIIFLLSACQVAIKNRPDSVLLADLNIEQLLKIKVAMN